MKQALRRANETFVALEKQKVFHITAVCPYYSLNYLESKAHAPYYIVIYDLYASTIFTLFFQIMPLTVRLLFWGGGGGGN